MLCCVCYCTTVWKWMREIALFLGNHLSHQSNCMLCETHRSSSFSLLSLSKSLSFLTCMGALGTNQAAMNLHMTTTCCQQRERMLGMLSPVLSVTIWFIAHWFFFSSAQHNKTIFNILSFNKNTNFVGFQCRVTAVQRNQGKKRWIVGFVWSCLRLTSNRMTNAKRTAKISQNCWVKL